MIGTTVAGMHVELMHYFARQEAGEPLKAQAETYHSNLLLGKLL